MILIISVVLLFTLLILWYKNERQGPPGPIGVPILGYFPFLGSNAVMKIQKLSEKYGSIMKVNLLNENFYFLNSFEAIEEAFGKQGDCFAGRVVDQFNLIKIAHKNNVAASEGKDWEIQKKFFVNKLAGLGMGKTNFGYKIHEICDDLIENIKSEKEINNLGLYLTNFTSNIMSSLLYSKKYSITDPIYQQLIENIEKATGTGTDMYFVLSGPVLELIVKMNRSLWKQYNQTLNQVFDFMLNLLKERIENGETNEFNDILDYCIKEMNGPNSHLFDIDTIIRNYLALFIAGSDTTSSTLNFGIFLMAKNQEIQRKVFNEIMEVFGKEHRVLFTEIEKVNYMRAVIAEIQRFACVAPFGVLHASREDATVCGYRFPKRSKFVANIYSVSRDKKRFKNPEAFDPCNFLDENGNYTPIEANIPFGIGKRKCLGFKLAEMELFTGFTRLIQEFEWLPPKDEEMKLEIKEKLIRQVSPYKIIAKIRI